MGMMVLFFVSLLGCGGKDQDAKNKSKERPVPAVDGYIVKTEAFSEAIEVPGSVVANEVTEVHPEVSGRIVSLNVAEGRYISKGAVLAKIYDGDLQAQLRKLQAQLKIAQVNEDRASQLLKIQGISRQDYDNTALSVTNIKADIDIVRTEIAKTVVRAPFSGKVGLKDISPGAYVTPTSVIATINQTSTLKIDFSVPEKYTSRIYKGQIVTFTVEGNEKLYSARITATESNVDVSNRSLTVRAIVTNSNENLIPGSFARVKLGFAPKSDAIFVPSQAIVPTARGKQIILYTGGKAVFNNVETDARDSSRVEIVTGLKPGDTIVISGMMTMKPDMKIKINKVY